MVDGTGTGGGGAVGGSAEGGVVDARPGAQVEPKVVVGAARGGSKRSKGVWGGRLARGVVALGLGLLTTFGVSAGLAVWVPLDGTGGAAGTPSGMAVTMASLPRVTISADGDHLQPWHIVLERTGSRREVWFEKGRVYMKRDASGRPIGHPDASSAAVSCWSFATSARNMTPIKMALPVDPEIRGLTHSDPPRAWGVAVEQRGFPFLAFKGRVMGTMDSSAPQAWAVSGGADVDHVTVGGNAAGGGGSWRRESLASIRLIPFEPMWKGLIGDTAVYGAAWYVLLLVPGVVAARFRRLAGACPKCGYDLAGQTRPGCPECGWGRGEGGGSRAMVEAKPSEGESARV